MKSKFKFAAAALFASCALAVPAPAGDNSVTVDVFSMDAFSSIAGTITDSGTYTALGNDAGSVTTSSVTTYFGSASSGVYAGAASSASSYSVSSGLSLFLAGATGDYAYVAVVISASDLLDAGSLGSSSAGSLTLTFESYTVTYAYTYTRSHSGGSNANSKVLPTDDEGDDDEVSASSIVSISDEDTVSNTDGSALSAWVVSGGEAAAVALATDDDGYTITISDLSEIDSVVILFSLAYSTSYNSATFAMSDITAVITIPEPSAFGVLAGISALALVAARRRRSRKIA